MGSLALVWIAAVALGQNPDPAADQSLTIEQYVEKGVPSPERPWSSLDYKAAREALLKIKAENPSALPRKASPRSKVLFQRMVDPTNLKNIRFEESLALGVEIASTVGLYLEEAPNGEQLRFELDVEYLDLTAYMTRVSANGYDLTNQYFEKRPEAVRQDPSVKETREQLYTIGILGFLEEVLSPLLSESELYRQKTLDAFALRLPEIMAPLWPYVKEVDRKELLQKIKKQAEDCLSPKVRAEMVKLEERLQQPKPADEKDPKP